MHMKFQFSFILLISALFLLGCTSSQTVEVSTYTFESQTSIFLVDLEDDFEGNVYINKTGNANIKENMLHYSLNIQSEVLGTVDNEQLEVFMDNTAYYIKYYSNNWFKYPSQESNTVVFDPYTQILRLYESIDFESQQTNSGTLTYVQSISTGDEMKDFLVDFLRLLLFEEIYPDELEVINATVTLSINQRDKSIATGRFQFDFIVEDVFSQILINLDQNITFSNINEELTLEPPLEFQEYNSNFWWD